MKHQAVNKQAVNREVVNRGAAGREAVNRETVNQQVATKQAVKQQAVKQQAVKERVLNRDAVNRELGTGSEQRAAGSCKHANLDPSDHGGWKHCDHKLGFRKDSTIALVLYKNGPWNQTKL